MVLGVYYAELRMLPDDSREGIVKGAMNATVMI